MPHIQVLPKQVADMIAAGEVVERPASVVKELVENAIDAGSTQLTVEIRHGGATYIRVTDNGSGIPKEEVATAFLRHATSKLRSAEDLDRIGTLGFRGEALAAISAVSNVQILTKPRDQEMGWSYSIENSETLEEGPAGCPDGTTIVVRDVFFSVPARYKYLKTDAAEASAIHAILEREALAHPEVAFRFVRDGKTVFTTPGDGKLEHVIDVVMPGEIAQMLAVKSSDGAVTVTGFVGKPTRCRGSRAGQFTFVNGRWIRSKLLTAAIEQAYKNQHMVGKFPIAVLHIELALDKVDVNAHPTKTEVRFVEEKALFGKVYHAVESALTGAVDRPSLQTVPAQSVASAPSPAQPGEAKPPVRPAAGASAAVTAPKPGEVVFRSPAASVKPRPTVWPKEEWRGPAQRPEAPAEKEEIPSGQTPPEGEQLTFAPPPVEGSAPPRAPAAVERQPDQVSSPATPESSKQPEVIAESEGEIPWRIVGEALKTYIIVEQGDKLLFIDKHAAHERMGFDRLKAQEYRPMLQELLEPLAWRPDPEDRAVLLEHVEELEDFGFQLEDFGNDSIVVRAAPDFLAYADIAVTLEELARQYALTGDADPAAQRDELLHTMACKAAVKGGQKNIERELEVIARAVMAGQVTHCPHGRPVATELTKKQLEKQFGRA